jgi:hypothetical protein
MGVALAHKAGSDDLWNGGPVSLVAWEDGQLILTHGDFAHRAATGTFEDFRAVRLSGNAAEDLLVYNRISLSLDHVIELLVLEDDRWVLAETKPVVLPEGFELGSVPLIPRDPTGAPLPLIVERDVGIQRLVRGADAWTLSGMVPLPPELPEGGAARQASYGDVDGDGREDVLVSFYRDSTEDDRRLVLLMADPTSPIGFGIVDLGPYTLYDLDLGDFDGDGRLDILEYSGNDPLRFQLHRGHGDGTFDAPMSGEVPTPDKSGGVVAGDVDGDGLRELFVGSGSPDLGLFVIKRFASGGASELMFVTSEAPTGAVDMNGDGHFDLVTRHAGPEAYLLISVLPEP